MSWICAPHRVNMCVMCIMLFLLGKSKFEPAISVHGSTIPTGYAWWTLDCQSGFTLIQPIGCSQASEGYLSFEAATSVPMLCQCLAQVGDTLMVGGVIIPFPGCQNYEDRVCYDDPNIGTFRANHRQAAALCCIRVLMTKAQGFAIGV